MLIHCYLKCIEFPWKMIHSCRLKLINNNDEPGWHLEYLHAYLALPCMREHCHAPQLWQHIWKKDGFELKGADKWVISATGTRSSSRTWCFACKCSRNLWSCRRGVQDVCSLLLVCTNSFITLNFTIILTWLVQCRVPDVIWLQFVLKELYTNDKITFKYAEMQIAVAFMRSSLWDACFWDFCIHSKTMMWM